jgi:OOP family OmpA-OmpF porin
MKKILLVATAVLLLLASTAMADSIAGKVGVTARGGASYIFNSSYFTDEVREGTNLDMKPGWGWTAGAGIMYGITDHLAVDFDAIYMQAPFDASGNGVSKWNMGTGRTIDLALGAQWRFIPKSRFVPYVGAGVDFLINNFDLSNEFKASADVSSVKVDNTWGGHLSVGADFFITPNIALNAEVRGLYSTKGDLKNDPSGITYAKYDPSNVSGFLGIRFFFGGAKEASAPIAKEVAPEPLPPPPVEEVKAAPEAAATVEQKLIEQGRATLDVKFDFDKTFVKPIYYKEIEGVTDVLKKYPDMKIVVEGHTDNIGTEKYNLNLSQRRANAIKAVMVKKFNIESSRITPKGFGYSRPIADNSTKEGRQLNRRVEAAVDYTIEK